MNLVTASFKVMPIGREGLDILKFIENCGRVCYKSEDRVTDDSCIKFVTMLLNKRHFSVLEHQSVTVKIICDRGVSHELVRHRLASYSQESTRYCNYAKNDAITVVDIREFIKTCIAKSNQPDKLHSMEAAIQVWEYAMETCEDAYMQLIKLGVTPEIARGVLPTNLKTELYITCNLREWYEIFSQRTNYNPSAHPQMRDIMDDLLLEFTTSIPVIFDALVLNTI